MKKIWEVARPHLIAMAIFLAVFAAYFHPQLNGKVVGQSDILQGMGMTKEAKDYLKETGNHTLWTNAMFGGMPMYQIASPQPSNLIRHVLDPITRLFISAPISMFFVAAMCLYILLMVLGVNRWIAIIGGLAFSFSTNNMVLFAAGHTSKLKAISVLPLALAGVYLLLNKKKYLSGAVVFLIAMSINIMANHYQMTYYFAIGMLFFMIVYLIYAVKNGEVLPYLKAGAIMLITGILAIGPSYTKFSTTYEYSKFTMRADSDLKREARERNPEKNNSSSGLNWDYAMMWSYAPVDLLATFIPGVVGGSSGEELSKDYEITKAYGRGKTFRAPLYWGGADSTEGPPYFGVVVMFLLVIGLFMVPNNGWKIGIVIGALMVVFLALGSHFEAFNRIFFEHFPKFKSFRAPSSAIGVVAVFIPILAMVGFSSFLTSNKSKEEKKKVLFIASGIVGGLALIIALIGSSIFDLSHFKDENYLYQSFNNDVNQYNQFMDILQDSRAQFLRTSAWKAVFFVVVAGAILYGFVVSKLKAKHVILALGALVVIDLVSIDLKYLNEDNFISKHKKERPFTIRPVDQQIIQSEPKGRGYYRVLDLSISTFNSSAASYFHNTVGGYSAVKMSRIQDVIDSAFSPNISADVMDMMNTKYIVSKDMKVFPNPNALGNAWFVDSFIRVSTATEELATIKDFNSVNTAVIHSDFEDYTKDLKDQPIDSFSTRSIEMVQYEPNRLVYNSKSSKDEFVVFSEMWYGPNVGWDAYIDGEKVDHIRVNYILRGMKLPAGEHEIIFEFKPQTFEKGEKVSMATSVLILLLIVGWIGMEMKRLI